MLKRPFACIFIVWLVTACSPSSAPDLKDDYKVVRVYGNARSLITPDSSVLVMHSVVSIADNEHFIIGLREESKPKITLPEHVKDQPYGYFVYNKHTDTLKMGLAYDAFTALLEDKGIDLILGE